MKKRIINQIIFWLFIVLVLFFLGKTFLADIGELKNYKFHFNWWWIGLAFLTYFLGYILLSCPFYFMLRNMKYRVSFWDNLAYTIYSQFGTYVPGKVWVYIIRYKLLKKHRVEKQDFLAMFGIDSILILSSAGILSLFFVANFYPTNTFFIQISSLVLFLLVLFGLYPKLFYPLTNWLLKRLKQPLIDQEKQIGYLKLLGMFILNLLYWIFLGIAFYFFTKSIIVIGTDKLFSLVGVYISAVWLGLIVFLIPHGFGVRETVKTVGLSTFLPPSVAVFLAIISRLWSLINELVWSFVLFVITRRKWPSLENRQKIKL